MRQLGGPPPPLWTGETAAFGVQPRTERSDKTWVCRPQNGMHARRSKLTMPPPFSSLSAIAGRPLRAYHRWFIRRPTSANRQSTGTRGPAWFMFASVAIILVGAGIRASFLDHPMRYDESMAYVKYVVLPLWRIPLLYDDVQNHILHTMLVHESVRWLGDSPAAMRLPALLAGLSLIPGVIVLSRRMGSSRLFALLAGAAVAVSNVLVDYSSNARGYTLVAALTLGMCLATVGLVREPRRRRRWASWSLLAVMGMFTIPIMALPIAGLSGLILLDAMLRCSGRRRRSQSLRLAVHLVLVITASALLYLPALICTGPALFLGVRHGVAGYSQAAIGSTSHLVSMCWHDWTLDFGFAGVASIAVGLAISMWMAARRRDAIRAMPLLVGAFAATVAMLSPVTTYPRLWMFLLPIAITGGISGLGALPGRRVRGIVATALAVALTLAGYRVTQREFLLAEDANTLVDAELIAKSLIDFEDRQFALVTTPATYAIRYYYTTSVDVPHPAHPSAPQVKGVLVAVNHTQTLEEVLSARGDVFAGYAAPVLHRELPHTRLYWMPKLPETRSVALKD